MNNLNINKMNLEDLNSIKNILTSEFDNFWNFSNFYEELKCENSYFLKVTNKKNEIIGFAGFKKIFDEADIMNIVVKKSFRKKGIGKFLLENLISYAKDKKIYILALEVNENNLPAISLYHKLNFINVGIRKNYYGENKNGIIMKKAI